MSLVVERQYLKEPHQHLLPGVISIKKFLSAQRAKNKSIEIFNRRKRALDDMVLLKAMTLEEGIEYIKTQPWRKLNGQLVESTTKMKAVRVRMFASGQTKCVKCGLEGTHFRIERHKNDKVMPFSINLYGVDKYGIETMLTWDHILPRSQDGANTFENAQCMCRPCNEKKGNKLSLFDMIEIATHPHPAQIWKTEEYKKMPFMDIINSVQATLNRIAKKQEAE